MTNSIGYTGTEVDPRSARPFRSMAQGFFASHRLDETRALEDRIELGKLAHKFDVLCGQLRGAGIPIVSAGTTLELAAA